MRISFPKLLIVVALILVFLVEGRTVLAFFGIGVSPLEAAIVGLVAIAVVLLWAVWPTGERSADAEQSCDD